MTKKFKLPTVFKGANEVLDKVIDSSSSSCLLVRTRSGGAWHTARAAAASRRIVVLLRSQSFTLLTARSAVENEWKYFVY